MKPVKLLLVGPASVGKTCIVNQIAYQSFTVPTPTVGASSNAKVRIAAKNGDEILFNIWDTAGSERYRSLTPMYFSGASVAILVYDITSLDSFKQLDQFLGLLHERAPPNCHIVIVGNKSDLEDGREVPREDGEKYAQENRAAFFIETSAKDSSNIRYLFQECASLPGLKKSLRDAEAIALNDEPAGKGCC